MTKVIKILCVLVLLNIRTVWSGEKNLIGQQEIPLVVHPQENVGTYWRIRGATLSEGFNSTEGTLEIENVSKSTIEVASFYANYFDAAGRLCFNAMFDIAGNFGGEKGSLGPGEVRTLHSSAHLLAPAIDSKELKLYLVRQKLKGGTEAAFESSTIVNSPVLVQGFGSSDLPWQEVILGQELMGVQRSILDLVLSRLHVGKDGNVRTVNVLDSVSPSLESWFREFVSHLRFAPARRGGVAVSGDTLLLVRALLTDKSIQEVAYIPRLSPWTVKYIQSEPGAQVPAINTVFLQPRDTPFTEEYLPNGTRRRTYAFPEKPAGGYYVYNDIGSQWSLGVAGGRPSPKH